MPSYESHIDNQPLRYYNGRPIYLTAYLTAGLAVGYLIMILLQSGGFPVGLLTYHPSGFRSGAFWQPLTYVFVDRVSFFTPLALFCFYSWGAEVEKYLGRKQLLQLCGALLFLPVLVISICYLIGFEIVPLHGNYLLVSGILITFATLYPEMDYFGGWIPLKWFAFVCVAFGSVMYFPERDWAGLATLWVNCAAGYLLVRHARGLFDFKFPQLWPQKKTHLRVVPRPEVPRRAATVSGSESEVDELLDKIARTGLASLTEAEKLRLETLRQKMLRKNA